MQIHNLKSIKKNRLSGIKKVRSFLRVFYAVLIIIYAISHFQDYGIASLKRATSYLTLAHKSKASSVQINIDVNTDTSIHSFGTGLVSINTDFASFINLVGLSEADIPLGYSSPNIEFGKNQAIIYDIGQNDYIIANSFGVLSEHETSARILSVAVDDINENYAIVTDDTGYNSVLRVYNVRNNEIFKWSTSSYNIIRSSLYKDILATLCIKQDGINFISYLIVFDISSGEMLYEYPFADDFPIDMHIFENSNICVIFQNKLQFITKTGQLSNSSEHLALKSYNLDSHHNIIYATNNFDDTYSLCVADSTGKEISSKKLYEKINSIDLTPKYIYVLTNNTLYKYDYFLNLIDTEYTEVNILKVITFANDVVYAVYSDEMVKLF